jgi:hypothetical protein
MKNLAAALAVSCLVQGAAIAGTLSTAEANSLRADVSAVTTAFERGDAEGLITKTHPSLQALAGGREAFARLTRQSVKQALQSGVRFLSSEVGSPTQTYPAGEEEVCFVPRTSIMEYEGKKVRSITFMIAARRVGGTDWKYLDGVGLRKHPHMLYQLLPKLQPGVTLPPNTIEAL